MLKDKILQRSRAQPQAQSLRRPESERDRREVRHKISHRLKKKTDTVGISFKDAATGTKIAVVDEIYPKLLLEREKPIKIHNAILMAYENILEQGPQFPSINCLFRSGHMIVTCADEGRAQLLTGSASSLRAWKGASFVANSKASHLRSGQL